MTDTFMLKRLCCLLVMMLVSCLPLCAQVTTVSVKPLSIGTVRTINSDILREERILNIYLPDGFDSSKTYPVIYLLDGSFNEDLLHITGLVQFFNMMFPMPPCIVVGIANIDRKRDFTFPTTVKKDKEAFPTTGGSAAFIRFIEEELQPYVSSTYKVNSTRYLIGQSLGGLLATEILLTKPSLFSHYFIISPSLWWDNESLLVKASQLLQAHREEHTYVYLSVGKEGDVMEKDADRLANIIRSGSRNIKLDFTPMPDENHATILHHSLYNAFKLLFPYKE